ncbi:MAG: hypothetical protein ACRC8S_04425 [Fimbriiglobus sp.]
MTDVLRQVVVAACLVVMLWTNLAGGGRADGDRDPGMYTAFPTAFSPAPYTFAVWAPIFLGCIALTVYQGLPSMRHDPRFQTLGWLVAAAFLLTALTAYTPIGVSNAVITGLLVALALAYRDASRTEPHTAGFAWCVRLPLAIFVAWCTVATILNACQWAVSLGWPVGSASAALLILIATLIGVAVVVQWREVAFGLVLVWAFWGIVAARPEASAVVGAAAVATLALIGAAAYAWWGGSGSPPVPAS